MRPIILCISFPKIVVNLFGNQESFPNMFRKFVIIFKSKIKVFLVIFLTCYKGLRLRVATRIFSEKKDSDAI